MSAERRGEIIDNPTVLVAPKDSLAGATAQHRRARIERLIAQARRAADPTDPLGVEARARLMETSGLSREGIELALTRHLEVDPSEAEMAALLRSCGPRGDAPNCHIVIAANVCTSALRAIAVGLAASPSVFVRPSSRDPALAELLVRELARDEAFLSAGGSIALTPEISASAGDELHIYGSDSTVEALSKAATPGVIVRGHGTGFGVALIGERIDPRAAARDLAFDIIPFDQKGCLSPRIALVEGIPERAEAVFEALHEELNRSAIPRGPLSGAILAELALYRASIEALGAFRDGPSHAVGLDPSPRALILPPAARVVHIVPVSAASAGALLAPWARFIAAFGLCGEEALAAAASAVAPRARRSKLGEMQRPPLDGPVDQRTY